eukprot:3230906-Pyramimonas_sp.AAC.1
MATPKEKTTMKRGGAMKTIAFASAFYASCSCKTAVLLGGLHRLPRALPPAAPGAHLVQELAPAALVAGQLAT